MHTTQPGPLPGALRAGLAGALVGLARAANGAIATPAASQALLAGLRALPGAPPPLLEQQAAAVRQAKEELAPGCRFCTARCGRTDDYDLARLQEGPAWLREEKGLLLAGLCALAQAIPEGEAAPPILYEGLLALGEEWDEALLRGIRARLGSAFWAAAGCLPGPVEG